MRDPNRIPIILERIKKVWESNPDFRLGQLICVFTRPYSPCNEIFNIEQENLLLGIERFENRFNGGDNKTVDKYWERYPNISNIAEDDISIELIESFIEKLRKENNQITITPTNLMKLNNAPVNDNIWLKKQTGRVKKIQDILIEIAKKNTLEVIEIGYKLI